MGEPAAGPSGTAFDLGGGEQHSEPDAFVIGENTPEAPSHGPMFDLDDEESAPKEDMSVSPDFDLSDANSVAHPAEPVTVAPVPARAAGTSMGDSVFQAISSVLTDLASELRRALEYYSTRYGKVPSTIFLCGGTAKMPKLDEFLSRELGVQVRVADPVKNLNVSVPAMSDQYLREVSPLFSVSIGLAVRDMIG